MSGALGGCCVSRGWGKAMLFKVFHQVAGGLLAVGSVGLGWGGPPVSSSLGLVRGMSNWRKSLLGPVWGRAQGLALLGSGVEGTGGLGCAGSRNQAEEQGQF